MKASIEDPAVKPGLPFSFVYGAELASRLVGLGEEVLVGIELLDVNLAHEVEAHRCADSNRDPVAGKEAEVAGFADLVDKLLDLLVAMLEHQRPQSTSAQVSANIRKAPQTTTVDVVLLRDVAIVGDDAAGGEEFTCDLVDRDVGLIDAVRRESRAGVVLQNPEPGTVGTRHAVLIGTIFAAIEFGFEAERPVFEARPRCFVAGIEGRDDDVVAGVLGLHVRRFLSE